MVFPAYAGMFRTFHRVGQGKLSFPRIRGDVPQHLPAKMQDMAFSPHTRGCSARISRRQVRRYVFPAYAGMFPGRFFLSALIFMFSPHTRGCSAEAAALETAAEVFPAYAGMFHILRNAMDRYQGFPRIRGDVPLAGKTVRLKKTFSPHTRGCSPGL